MFEGTYCVPTKLPLGVIIITFVFNERQLA